MKRKINVKRIVVLIIIVVILIIGLVWFFQNKNHKNLMIDLSDKNLSEIKDFSSKHKLNLIIHEVYDEQIPKGNLISQNILKDKEINEKQDLIIYISLGKMDKNVYIENNVDESGRVPIMMYHGIHNLKNDETGYTGGNIDKEGYQRTNEAFRNDLEFFYSEGYRMIRLIDYVNGVIDVELGKSPIILTFDDGLINNIKVIGLDDDKNIMIDPNCAVGILEEFKKKYPNFQVTATFFLNGGLFHQPEYNKDILTWLVDNGYDIGNHSYNHSDFTKIDAEATQTEIGKLYQKLEEIIPNKYVNIVALPFGSPYNQEHSNFQYILNSNYNNKTYNTISTLRVGWEADYSPFSKSFNQKFLKRIRAYDNDGINSDIEMNFNILKNTRYISDGDKNKIVVPVENLKWINENSKYETITYEKE